MPLTPAGPVDPERATIHVYGLLPRLTAQQARALALVVLGGFDRADAAADLGISQHDVARALAAARTALRRSVRQLQGSGWCLRAEALLSDRLDDVLVGAGAVRLDVHLRNCPRCVDHERRLIQAQNALVAEFGREPAPGEAAELTLVQPADTPEPTRESSDASHTGSLAGIVAVSSGVLVLLAGLLVIAAIAFALVAALGL